MQNTKSSIIAIHNSKRKQRCFKSTATPLLSGAKRSQRLLSQVRLLLQQPAQQTKSKAAAHRGSTKARRVQKCRSSDDRRGRLLKNNFGKKKRKRESDGRSVHLCRTPSLTYDGVFVRSFPTCLNSTKVAHA